LLRLAVALLFGFMSLGHWPVMAFASGSSPAIHHHAKHGVEHHQAAAQTDLALERADVASNASQPACHAVGCFLVTAPTPIAAPSATLILFDRLSPGATDRIDPAIPEPADRPPRLQV
jgi:hypothetical protein